jgi:hypothetical protein
VALTARAGAALLLAGAACAGGGARYRPRTRNVTITAVPLLVREDEARFGFLRRDFAPGGVLEGKEVYAFAPASVTVVAGDTVAFDLINPEDDPHSFVLMSLAVPMPPQSRTRATWVPPGPGIYRFQCAIPSHLPMMAGEVVVLPARGMGA